MVRKQQNILRNIIRNIYQKDSLFLYHQQARQMLQYLKMLSLKNGRKSYFLFWKNRR